MESKYLDWLLMNEQQIRLTFFFGILCLVAFWEILAPRRKLNQSKGIRWYSNLGIVVINTLLIRLVFPFVATGFAVIVAENQWGLFHQIDLPYWPVAVITFLFLDFAIYFQHFVFHHLPWMWRLHRMHHTDLDYDVTTGSRFHPIEIILSMLIKIGIVFLLGVTPEVVLIFEITLNLTAMFNHGNIYLPGFIDKYLRLLVVTPDMHRVHHSVFKSETNSNYGFNFPWWDRIFGTYLHQPQNGHLNMKIGLTIFNNPENLHLHKMLIQPFLAAHKSDD
jgi:sterol desaturase/sphingolipid hydroxylase (fatty acid hydroxylase superfamily)